MELKIEVLACFAVWAGLAGAGIGASAIVRADDEHFYEEQSKTNTRFLADEIKRDNEENTAAARRASSKPTVPCSAVAAASPHVQLR